MHSRCFVARVLRTQAKIGVRLMRFGFCTRSLAFLTCFVVRLTKRSAEETLARPVDGLKWTLSQGFSQLTRPTSHQ
jgi:hypothetical protein